jgi:hypothetical protein
MYFKKNTDMPEYVYFYFFRFLRKLLILTKNFILVLSHIFRRVHPEIYSQPFPNTLYIYLLLCLSVRHFRKIEFFDIYSIDVDEIYTT